MGWNTKNWPVCVKIIAVMGCDIKNWPVCVKIIAVMGCDIKNWPVCVKIMIENCVTSWAYMPLFLVARWWQCVETVVWPNMSTACLPRDADSIDQYQLNPRAWTANETLLIYWFIYAFAFGITFVMKIVKHSTLNALIPPNRAYCRGKSS